MIDEKLCPKRAYTDLMNAIVLEDEKEDEKEDEYKK